MDHKLLNGGKFLYCVKYVFLILVILFELHRNWYFYSISMHSIDQKWKSWNPPKIRNKGASRFPQKY